MADPRQHASTPPDPNDFDAFDEQAASAPGEGDWADQAAQRGQTLRDRLSGRWQIPLFLVGMVVLLTGLPRLMTGPTDAPIDDHIAALETVLNIEHDYAQAAAYADKLLETAEGDSPERPTIHLLRARANYALARQAELRERRQLAQLILDDLSRAARPIAGDAALLLMRGQSHAWLGHVTRAERDLSDALELIGSEDVAGRRHIVAALWDISPAKVARELDAMLGSEDLSLVDRTWAVQRRAQLMVEEARIDQAVALLERFRTRLPGGSAQDRVDIQQARIRYKAATSDLSALTHAQRDAQAEKALLTLQAVELRRDPADIDMDIEAELYWLLGELHFLGDRPVAARQAFERVTRFYPRSEYARASRLGVAKSLALYEQLEENEALAAYKLVVEDLSAGDDRLVDRRVVQGSLLELYAHLKDQQRWAPAHQFLVLLEQILEPHATHPSLIDVKENQAMMLHRLARQQQARAAAIRSAMAAGRVPATQPEEADTLVASARGHLVGAGDAYLRAAYLATADDLRSGENLQKAATCYDEAGELLRAIGTLHEFIRSHPSDQPSVARAIFNLGKAYQAASMFEQAIEQYQRLTVEFPKAPDANKSLVPMAQCHKALNQFDQAEAILHKLLEDDETFRPDSVEFTEALFELAKLLYERGVYRQAIARLDEALQRYPDHEQAMYSLFYLADSYRRSGLALDAAIASANTPIETHQLAQTRADWLSRSRQLFDTVVARFEDRAGPDGELGELDWYYLRNAYFFRADCMFDLGQYEEAIWLYDLAALKYQGQPEAVAAYIQIVNCYQKMGKPEQARTANERAKWLLKKLPAGGFASRPLPLSKDYFADWLDWAGDSGMW